MYICKFNALRMVNPQYHNIVFIKLMNMHEARLKTLNGTPLCDIVNVCAECSMRFARNHSSSAVKEYCTVRLHEGINSLFNWLIKGTVARK